MTPTDPCLAEAVSYLWGDGTEVTAHLEGEGLWNSVYRVRGPAQRVHVKCFETAAGRFPQEPLVSREERAKVAFFAQAVAGTVASADCQVPRILYHSSAPAFTVMETVGARGNSLIRQIRRGSLNLATLRPVLSFLRRLHTATEGVDLPACLSNRAFLEFKLRLQFEAPGAQLSRRAAARLMSAASAHRVAQDCLNHGDLNSANILLLPTGFAIIDFEQAHVGSPVYDLAYLLSELVIYAANASTDDGVAQLLALVFAYSANIDELGPIVGDHVAAQVRYRLCGPSASVWTGHVNKAVAASLVNRSETHLNGPEVDLARCLRHLLGARA